MLIGKRKYLWLLSVLGVEKRVVYFAVSVGSFIALQAQTNFPPKLPSVKGRLNFSSKSTTAVNVHLTESLLDNWLKNNHITVDIIYDSRSLFCGSFSFKIISQPQKTEKNPEFCGNVLKLDLSE